MLNFDEDSLLSIFLRFSKHSKSSQLGECQFYMILISEHQSHFCHVSINDICAIVPSLYRQVDPDVFNTMLSFCFSCSKTWDNR